MHTNTVKMTNFVQVTFIFIMFLPLSIYIEFHLQEPCNCRKRTTAVSLAGMCLVTAASAATDSFVFYTAMKIADGFFSAGLGLVRGGGFDNSYCCCCC